MGINGPEKVLLFILIVISMKGDTKRAPSRFKKGYMPWNKGKSMSTEDSSEDSNDSPFLPEPTRTVRMKEKEYYLVTNTSRDGTSRTLPDCEGASGSTRLLRPAKASSSDLMKDREHQDTDGVRLVDNKKMMEAWNTAYRIHTQEASECSMPCMEIVNEKKWGVCWKITLKCINCELQTPEFKLYKEVTSNKPGPNPAAANIGLGIGLQDTPLGNTGALMVY